MSDEYHQHQGNMDVLESHTLKGDIGLEGEVLEIMMDCMGFFFLSFDKCIEWSWVCGMSS